MEKPTVMILCKCSDGHVVEMFPEKCVGVDLGTPYVEWECPRCENPTQYYVEL